MNTQFSHIGHYGLFVELLQVSLGVKKELSITPSNDEWRLLYLTATKQTLLGVVFDGIEKLPKSQQPSHEILSRWIANVIKIEQSNRLSITRIKELSHSCNDHELQVCLLKGQSVARLYPNPLRRQSGDIDVWVRGQRNQIIQLFQSISPLKDISYHHAHCDIFNDTDVEVHFTPCWMYNPITNYKLQSFFKNSEELQFSNRSDALSINLTLVYFDLVYSAVHIYRHLFSEGIGLRQLLDYYYIMKCSTFEQRNQAYKFLCSLGMGRFTRAMMYVLEVMFSMSKDNMYVCPDEKIGRFLLSEIMQAGNFGKFDGRIKRGKQSLFNRFINSYKRNLKFVKYFPSEVLWAPFWKIWHFVWRKINGYTL